MDATLKDFLNEINEIAPPDTNSTDTQHCHWQECFDESSGFPYYWNVKTNAVTWEMPDEFKRYLENGKKAKSQETVVPLFPSITAKTRIEEDEPRTDRQEDKLKKAKRKFVVDEVEVERRGRAKRRASSDDEKIVLISSYGGDTDSENEDKEEWENEEEKESREQIENKLITNILEEVKENVEEDKAVTESKEVTGFSLLAAYVDSENEDEESSKELEEIEEKTSHSTLFPIVKPIDVKQFIEPKPNEYLESSIDLDVEKRAFQRKRRIGVSLMNKKYVKDESEDAERKGFGFKNEVAEKAVEDETKNAKFGISFVKSETLNGDGEKEREIEEAQKELREKLGFLSEANDVVSPVQIMQIQLETLYAAYVDGSLKSSYLNRWLKETCEGLIKLEEAATPFGWLLQWDRLEKRYYYRNKLTDETQWNYPQIEDDAMDICTTPPLLPPADLEEGELINTPSPPTITNTINDLSMPTSEVTTAISIQPLPPGVEEAQGKVGADLNSVLNSFYTDIAALESTQQTITVNPKLEVGEEHTTSLQTSEIVPNKEVKKKKKVKVASLKKKNVSKLVEKWNNVQKDLN